MVEPKRYPGSRIEVAFEAARCRHFAECVRGAPAVFDTGRRPWVLPDGADADLVAEVVRRCPTGALTYRHADGGTEPAEVPTTIVATTSTSGVGPLLVRGDLLVAGARRTRAALCGCGGSAERPFCDGACERPNTGANGR